MREAEQSRERFKTAALVAAVALLAAAAPLRAQTILGRVVDEVNERPVGGAIVTLIARDGEQRARVLADSAGRFVLTPPEAGEFVLVAQRFGYIDTRSPLLALVTSGQAPLELLMAPEPLGLEGLEVSVEELAAEELTRMGLSPRQLGNRWISRDRIDDIPVKRDVGVIIERAGPSGLRVIRPENQTMGGDDMGLCISLNRATRMGRGSCALNVLDGVPISGPQALNIDPEAVESIAILDPIEAAFQYGTIGGNGAVLFWTRRGR